MVSYDISKVWCFAQPLVWLYKNDPSFDDFNDGSQFLHLAWFWPGHKYQKDKVGAGLAKVMSLPACVVPLRLSCSFGLWTAPIFELVVGHWHWPLVQVCLCPCCHVSSLYTIDLWGLQGLFGHSKVRWKRAWVLATPAQTIWRIVLPQAPFALALPQIWQLPSTDLMRDAALAYHTIDFTSISWGQATTWSAAILGIIPSRTYTAVAVIYWGELPWSPSPLNSANDSV